MYFLERRGATGTTVTATCTGLVGILINASATTMDKDKFVEANGIKIHYVEEGEGPPLLLIHGGGLT
ncbi:hypothetical protein MJM25_29265, partial [Salmonella enterica subsp. enterica serovar Lubbock]|nr:hypothetical protein [Salmonella enterica subsp. enterica serovar Lubbock]